MHLQLAFFYLAVSLVRGSVLVRHTGSSSDSSETSNGVLNLMEHSHTKLLLDDWIDRRIESSRTSSESQSDAVDIRGLYKTLKHHPALMVRRLEMGSRLPVTFEPLFTETRAHAGTRLAPTASPVRPDINSYKIEKRTVFDVGLSVPACPFTTEWKRLHQAKDINNTMVEVFQPDDDSNRYQWFYTVACSHTHGEQPGCRGVDSHRFTSRCIPKKSFVMALIRKPGSFSYDWDYVQVDTSCNCAISRR